jgi:hypothetical protein
MTAYLGVTLTRSMQAFMTDRYGNLILSIMLDVS